MTKAKTPPVAVDAEKEILGAMLISPDAVPKAVELLTPEKFYQPVHQRIFEAMVELFNDNNPIDTTTVYDQMKRHDKFHPSDSLDLVEISGAVSTGANVEFHARIVLEKYVLRSLISNSSEIMGRAQSESEDAFDLLDEAQGKILALLETGKRGKFVGMRNLVHDTVTTLQNLKHGELSGIPSGFSQLDNLTGGFQNSDLILIAGRPSMGKTSFALDILKHVGAKMGLPVGMFSLEMSDFQLTTRLLAMMSRVDSFRLRTGRLNQSEWAKIIEFSPIVADAPIYIDDSAGVPILELRARARRLKKEHDIKLLVIDYLQLIHGPSNSESREREIGKISASLKQLAKELDIPVIALSQLSRQSEMKEDKRPVLSNLRDSGTLEQDADVVLFVHRPEACGIKTVDGESSEGKAEIIIAKQRNGPTDSLWLTFMKQYSGFEPYSNITFYQETE